VEKGTETFRIPAPFQPEWVNVDAEKQLLCEKTDNKTNAQWVMQYDQGALYYDRREAVEALLATNDSSTTALIVGKAIYDKHASIRKIALDYLPKISKEKREFYNDIVREMAETDPESYIRAKCVELLWDVFEFRDIDFYSERMQDRSYTVAGAGFEYMYKLAPESTLGQARSLGNSVRGDLQYSLAEIYSEAAEREDHEYFKYKLLSEGGFSSGRILQSYTTYLIRMNDMDMISEGAQNIQEIAYIGQPWYLRLGAMRAMATLRSTCSDRKKTNNDYEMAEARISQMMYEVIEQEKHPSLQKYYKAYKSK
jgi:aminopeptidase N